MIKIACEPDFLPLTSMMNSPPEGLIIEILELTCARAGLTPNFVSTPLADQMTSLKEGKVDAIAFKAITPGHIRGCDFSTRFFITGAGWFAPAGNPWTIEKSAERPRVAMPGTGPLAAPLRSKYPSLEITETTSYDASLKAVAVNDADVAALNFHIGCYLARRSYSAEIEIPTQPYEALDIALAVGEGDPKNFLAKINPALEEILTSGRVLDIEAKWLS